MKITEYKNSVGSMKLSDEFKQNLKEKMLLEAQKSEKTDEPKSEPANITMSLGKVSKKYSKYAALAACLLLAVSAAGILSVSQNAFKSSKPNNFDASQAEGIDAAEIDVENDSFEEPSAAEDDAVEDPEDAAAECKSLDADSPEALESAVEGDDSVFEDRSQDTSSNNSSEDIPELNPTSGNGYSPDASPDYDGSYYGIDYIVSDVVGSARYNAVVVGKIDVNAKLVDGSANGFVPEAPQAPIESGDFPESSGPSSFNPHPGEIEGGTPDEDFPPAEDSEEDASDEESEPTSYEIFDADSDSAAVFEELTSGDSKKYYDIRDGVIAKLNNVGLIRFTILDGYDSETAIARNSQQVSIDPSCQTLYRINVTYDYFNSEDANAERLLVNTGNSRYQLIGRPAMEGEYIAVVTETESGVLTPVPELIYAVHNVRGLDIAYHLYSDDGFMIDPGNTNMGIMPEEVAVINSTENNPEIYTQKSSVRELTFYLRRNILRMEPNVLYFSDKRSSEASEDTPAQSDEPVNTDEAPRELIRAVFPSGKLKLTIIGGDGEESAAEIGKYTSDEVQGLRVNGIGVGAAMADARKAFLLSKYSFTPDAKITLCASEEDGGWFAIVTFSNNAVTKIEVFE